MNDWFPQMAPPDKGLTGFLTEQTQAQGIPEPAAGLSTLLVQLCQEPVVISKETGNWGKNGDVSGNQSLLLGSIRVQWE